MHPSGEYTKVHQAELRAKEERIMNPHEKHQTKAPLDPSMRIKITKDGPYIVSGGIPLDEEIITLVGHHREYHPGRDLPQSQTYALCRCGRTSTPPFCDGSHTDAHFDGTETASRIPFEKRAQLEEGPDLDLLDDGRCAYARFCHREDGDVWTMTEESGDPRIRKEAIKASTDCPAGRLVHYDKEGNPIEPDLSPRITLLQDPEMGVAGGIYVKGGIPLESADGSEYELRNRYALCRCGASRNKPFCDATHVNVGYQA